ncbi:UDP-N-acetylglucosamine 2-epimerase (non-hydrolyzing) [Henriciella barbarensis]|uniref:UDP-N-acetylglucosamine 2-epimerase (Non-hydrolyzing) n=1 Tax=Henriciella barbarensis TaxID=86342 RepID=A0A399QND8_9PROT|nr:UDP-N-acetylglucosamine 2-epimerase (non-hydrolyzing) [Henriciella barbarensis]RIJ20470.1 UDP-N-acetylglucosamine 2-epimerase (non-hydrolyzing) [Henriciella barbarensis]
MRSDPTLKKVVTVVGARPQFVKSSVVSRALQREEGVQEVLLHTGQHFDTSMSDVFFQQLDIPAPKYMLNLGGGTHGLMTGRMLEQIEAVLLKEQPNRVLVYGDTNSTLAAALAAVKLHIPVAHVEAGLRSFDRKMPEEINRILTDQVSDILFCPTESAVRNLSNEEIYRKHPAQIVRIGDVMEDATRLFGDKSRRPQNCELERGFILATAHRAENTNCQMRLKGIVKGLNALNQVRPVVLPLHPRTRHALARLDVALEFKTIAPVGYLEMLWLLQHCGLVATDSGGVQKEAFFHGKHCITLRDSTEWVELLDEDVNVLVGTDARTIEREGIRRLDMVAENDGSLYGGGHAGPKIASLIAKA